MPRVASPLRDRDLSPQARRQGQGGLMRSSRFFPLAIPAILAMSWIACHNSDTTTAPGSLANVTVTGPGSAGSGQSFTMNVAATAVGINTVQNAAVTVMIPAQCTITSLDASGGTSATQSGG